MMATHTFVNPLHTISRHEIDSAESFAMYAQQKIGTPYPNQKQLIILRTKLKEFFEQYPDLDYPVLGRVVDWCKAKKWRPAHSYQILSYVRYAWSDGVLELDPAQRKAMARR